MSDVKEVGVIGQLYEDRTTGKIGVLESRDEKCKTLMMVDSEGKGFNISYSSFRSKWRKAKAEAVEANEVEIEKGSSVTTEGVDIVHNEDGYHFITEDFEVAYVDAKKDGTYFVSCFPDVYIDAVELRSHTSNFRCSRSKSGRDISFNVEKMPFEELVKLLMSAIVGINLYGYIED